LERHFCDRGVTVASLARDRGVTALPRCRDAVGCGTFPVSVTRRHWKRDNPQAEPEISAISHEEGPAMTTAQEGSTSSDSSDGVMVVSVWREGAEGFLGRLTATTPEGDSVVRVVSSRDELLEAVGSWLNSLT
jgi:hypothetical protein